MFEYPDVFDYGPTLPYDDDLIAALAEAQDSTASDEMGELPPLGPAGDAYEWSAAA